jgi:hypothetical protein
MPLGFEIPDVASLRATPAGAGGLPVAKNDAID